ncbi:MAG: GntR family transcriptional regulator [Actinobacteria bacterium]|nr:GntR family transcriptional regulator [Actinomycetota bacterium]
MAETTRTAALQPLEAPRSLAEDAAARIREQILAGGFHQGEHLVEARIAEQLNVSRGPVREAFKLLRAEGLLTEEPRRGTFVVSLSPRDVREIYGLRAAIEGRAARSLAERHDPGDVSALRARVQAIEEAARSNDVVAVSGEDLAFHDAVCRLSGNARLHEVFERYVPMLRALLRVDERMHGSIEVVAGQHRSLVDAIDSGDIDAAVAEFEAHCNESGEMIAEYLEGLSERRVEGETS